MIPVQIKQDPSEGLLITWDDGHQGRISLHTLRDQCPCAGCQGETILLRTYTPGPQQKLPGMYDIVGVQVVGHYAMQISWKDGHATGLYPWLLLRKLCECPVCLKNKQSVGS
jgi:DUF971 family protein